MCDCLNEELKKFLGKQLFLTIKGQDFKPKGILREVNSDFIVLNNEYICISAIVSFKLAGGVFK